MKKLLCAALASAAASISCQTPAGAPPPCPQWTLEALEQWEQGRHVYPDWSLQTVRFELYCLAIEELRQ